MDLMRITQQVHQLDPELTIYAKAPWNTGSEAALALEPDDTLVPESLALQGFTYFLEVSIASEVVPNLSHVEPSLTLEQWCERLITYAETDA
jgi:hypothetical protein